MSASRYLRKAARAAGTVERTVARVTAPGRNVGFPFRSPTVPGGVEVPDAPPSLGADYDTRWARTPVARAAREVLMAGPVRLGLKALADPEIRGHDRLDDLLRRSRGQGTDPPSVIFAPNHHSHIDTGLMVRSVPAAWRKRLVTAAAADYFFDKRWKARLSALALNAVPIDRESPGRKSADQMALLIDRGWSLVIYPEGGRSPDGWGQPFKGGAAYLSGRCGVPVVPVHVEGTGRILRKGSKTLNPSATRVTFGAPMRPDDGEDSRRFSARVERTVAALADEASTDWYTAR